MVTSDKLKEIADEAMKSVVTLGLIGDSQERNSETQQLIYTTKNDIRNAISKLWPIIAELRIDEQKEIL